MLPVGKQDQRAGLSGGVQVDEPLVLAAPEAKGQVLFLLDKVAVHQHVDEGQQLLGGLAVLGVGGVGEPVQGKPVKLQTVLLG